MQSEIQSKELEGKKDGPKKGGRGFHRKCTKMNREMEGVNTKRDV